MSEIVRTMSTTTTASTRMDKADETKTVEHITVRSSTEDRFSVGGLLDFAKALREAAAPDRAQIETRKSHDTGHLVSLSVEFQIKHDNPDPPRPPRPDTDQDQTRGAPR